MRKIESEIRERKSIEARGPSKSRCDIHHITRSLHCNFRDGLMEEDLDLEIIHRYSCIRSMIHEMQ